MKLILKFQLLLFVFSIVGISAGANAQSGRNSRYGFSEGYQYQSVSLERPNSISFELLGRGLIYGFNYDRSVSDSVGLGIGYSSIGGRSSESGGGLTMIPLYANFYFQPDSHRFYLSAGATYISFEAKGTVTTTTTTSSSTSSSESTVSDFDVSGSGLIPTVGTGYEFRSTGGFLFRASLYAFVGHIALPWPGVSVGGAF